MVPFHSDYNKVYMVSLSVALVKLVQIRHICHNVDRIENKTYICDMTIKTNTLILIVMFTVWAIVKSWFTGVVSVLQSLSCDVGWLIAAMLAIRTFDENNRSRDDSTKATNNATAEKHRENTIRETALSEDRAIANRSYVWKCRTELRKQMQELFEPILATPVWKAGGLRWIHKQLSNPNEITFHPHFIEQVLSGVSANKATKSDKVVVFKTWYMRLEDFKYEFDREYPSLTSLYNKIIREVDKCANISYAAQVNEFADKQFNRYYDAMRGTVNTTNNQQAYTDDQLFKKISGSFNRIRKQYHELLSKMNELDNRHVF